MIKNFPAYHHGDKKLCQHDEDGCMWNYAYFYDNPEQIEVEREPQCYEIGIVAVNNNEY